MDKQKLDLTYQDILTEKFNNLNLNISEYSFANLYLFRHFHQYELIIAKDLFIKGVSRDGATFLMLTRHPAELNKTELITIASNFDYLFPIPDQWLPLFDSAFFTSTFLEKESDYLYQLKKFQTYPGRHLDGKRNFIKQFLVHQPQSFSLTNDRIQDAVQILNQWQQEQILPSEQTDYSPCQEALSLLERLKLTGWITYVKDQPVGFIIGQKLNSDTYVVHFAKGLKIFNGIYPYLYQTLAKSLNEFVQFLNLEQDLGSPSLRKNKLSYRPDQMVHKFHLSLLNK